MNYNEYDKEAFDVWFHGTSNSHFAKFLRDNYPEVGIRWDRESCKSAWQAACEYKQKEIDDLKSQIYVTGSVHKEGDIKREMTWKESSDMMENFSNNLIKQLNELKVKFIDIQAENAKLHKVAKYYADADADADDVGAYARMVLKEIEPE